MLELIVRGIDPGVMLKDMFNPVAAMPITYRTCRKDVLLNPGKDRILVFLRKICKKFFIILCPGYSVPDLCLERNGGDGYEDLVIAR